MRIAIADNCGLKFCGDLKEHWERTGHEIKYERGASEYLAQWADVYYVEWIDGNLNYLWKLYNGAEDVSRTSDWDNNKKPKIICRMIDWDLWCGFVPFYEKAYVDFIDRAICIAPHIQNYILEKAPEYSDKLKLIRPGINLERFTLKSKETDGFQLGMVLGDMWWPKNHMGGLDIFTTLYKQNRKWRLHIRGQHEAGQYWPVMYEQYLESRHLKDVVTLYPPQDDMNLWYENIDILLHPGMKETFSYATAEAMAKGIPPVVNEFYGSREIWPSWILYNTHTHAVEKIKHWQNSKKSGLWVRKQIKKLYPNEKMFKEFDQVLRELK